MSTPEYEANLTQYSVESAYLGLEVDEDDKAKSKDQTICCLCCYYFTMAGRASSHHTPHIVPVQCGIAMNVDTSITFSMLSSVC